jgi:hypothetical protein
VPEREFVFVHVHIHLGHARLQPLLHVGHGAVVDAGADFLQEEIQQRGSFDVADALVALFLEPAFDRGDGLLVQVLGQSDGHGGLLSCGSASRIVSLSRGR